MIIKDITLEVGGGVPPVVDVSQVDDLWTFRFSFKYNNLPWNASGTPILTGAKPDGHIFAVRGTINAGQALVDATMQMTAVAGLVPCEVRLLQGNRSAAARFILNVAPQPGGQVVIASDSSLTAYAEVLSEIGELLTAAASIPDDLPGYVADWITENIRSDGTIVVDNTLTVSGAAADAKAAGDRIKALEDAKVDTDTTLEVEGAAADAKAAGDRFKALENKTKPGGVSTDMLADGSVTNAKLSPDLVLGLPRAATAAAMTDLTALYFYVGSEEGYVRNTLYYYNGEKWAPITADTDSGAAPLPRLYIYGDISQMTASKNEVKTYSYIFRDNAGRAQSSGYCSMKWQGESSLSYPKKNYTIKFFYDAPHKRKEKVNFFPALGLEKNKWVTKANWVDHSMARNIVSCRLWGQMVKSRHAAPPELLAAAPNWGAVNGFPIRIYVNDEFHGLYTFNIPKDEDTFAMDEENPLHCAICGDSNASTNDNPSAFRKAAISTWEIEVPDEWPTWTTQEEVDGQTVEVTHRVSDNFIDTIAFVINSSDADFVEHLNEHIDVESAIDYYLLAFLDNGIDSLARNLLMVTYNGGYKWYCSAYDKDTTWGNGINGNAFYLPENPCPGGYQCTNSLLWERLVANFGEALWDRWCELRSTILSPEYIKQQFDFFWQGIPADDFTMDADRWRGVDDKSIPQETVDFRAKIFEFIDARWAYTNAQIKAMRPSVPCTELTLSQSAITFNNGTPVTLAATVLPENTTDEVEWVSSDPTVVTVSASGKVSPLKNGSATITATCGNQTATCSVSVSGLSFAVTLVGSGATLTPTSAITPGAAYNGTITANSGYILNSVVVRMGGEDITATAYSNGTITIAAVTGDIEVTAVTEVYYDPTNLEYTLPTPLTFNGAIYADTGFVYDGESALSVVIDAENPQDMSTVQYFFGEVTGTNEKFCWRAPARTLAPGLNGGSVSSGVGAAPGTRFISVFRYNPATKVASIRSVVNGREVTQSNCFNKNGTAVPRDTWGNSLYIGGRNTNGELTEPMLSGKVNMFKLYSRRLSDAETASYLGLESLSDVLTVDLDDYIAE